MVALALAAGPAAPVAAAVEIAVEALATDLVDHPDAEAADIYKFLHQALYGPGHAIPDRAAAMDNLAREIDGLGRPLPGERPCRILGGHPTLVRVNLRPFVAGGGDPEELLYAFVATAEAVHPDQQQMGEAIAVVVKWLRSNHQERVAGDLTRLGHELEAKGYPAIHHSEAYVEAYKPAYRVVDEFLAAEYGWCD